MKTSHQSSAESNANAHTRRRRSPFEFLLLAFALSLPLWVLGRLISFQVLEGLTVGSLAVFCPLAAAVVLSYREQGAVGVKALLSRAFDYERIRPKTWYLPTLLLMPAVMFSAYVLMRLMGFPLPSPQIPLLAAVAMFLAFFIAALGEEVGWTGYATDPLQDRWTALQVALFLGAVTASWHLVLFLQAGRSGEWIAWQSLFIVASRVVTVWLYNNSGKSVFATILLHDTINLGSFLFPNFGSHYDPRVAGSIMAFVATVVTVVWGPRTLARWKKA